MWLFSNKSESAETNLLGFTHSFHREKTQKINTKPSLDTLDEGFVPCAHCGMEIDIASYEGLSIGRCPNCETPLFIPLLIKNYWLYEPLGGGGMGSVYRAMHCVNEDMDFAVKVLPRKRKGDRNLIEALINEAKICWELGEHQHLNKVVDFGLDGDEYFAVFEFIEGTRLDQIIDSPVKRPEKQIVLWGMQILSAEQHMYNKGYIFRDLKPQNIMIDKNGNAKLFDFGLAMSIDEALNNTATQIQGSPYYLPPERIVGTGESQYSEIYSLGMVLFHVLAKTTYYSADDIKTLVSKHVVSLRVNQVKSKLPYKTNPKLVQVIEKMIARLPEKRYSTYKEAAGELFKIYKASA